jgi:hypothetical protein
MGRIRSRFVRAMVESLQQETAGSALTRLRHGLPPHWLRVLSRDVFGRVEQDASLELSIGIDLLLAIERVLSGGSGKLVVRASAALAARVLYGSPALVVPGDFVRTLQHLRAPFEQPFVDTELRFSATGSAQGFLLELEIPGMPSAARWLGWSGLGFAEAAASFSGHDPLQFRFSTRLTADLASVSGRRTNTGLVELPPVLTADSSGARLRAAARRRTPPTNVAAQVDQILSRAPGMRASEPPATAPARLRSEPPASSGQAARSGTRAAVRAEAPGTRKKAR